MQCKCGGTMSTTDGVNWKCPACSNEAGTTSKDSYINKERTATKSNQNKDEGFALLINGVGYVTVIIGIIIAFVLITQFSKPGMFSNGKITGSQMIIVIGAAFYHFVFGMLCVGVAKILNR